jgi:hypothetical protein
MMVEQHPTRRRMNRLFLKPTPARLIMTAVLLLVAYGGYAQSWAFSGKDLAQRSPPLAGVFHPIPHLWELWVLLIAPLVLMFRLVGAQHLFDAGTAWLFWTLQVLYFYLLSCVIVFLWDKLARRRDC